MNPFAAIEALGGVSLVVIISGLLFLEEVGVPLPLTPGDLLLAVGGIAIAAGRVNPVLMIGLSLLAVVLGAMIGRELFSHLGWDRLMRIAGWLHATSALTRTGEMIDRSGWRAVFVARLIPGLRVHSTEIAGVRQMPRLRFFSGLLPATVVYVAAFTGLGAAFGRPILAVIHKVEHQGLVVALALVALIVIALVIRLLGRRALRGVGGWSALFTVRPTSSALIVIPVAIGLDFTGHAITVLFHLPLFLDSIGTVLAGVVAGPWVGGSVGFVSDLLISDTIDPSSAAYAVVAFALGFAVGLTQAAGRDSSRQRWVLVWLVAFGVSSTLSTALNLLLMGGHTGVPFDDALYSRLLRARVVGQQLPRVIVAYLSQAAIELPDKLVTVLAAIGIVAALPARAVRPARDDPGLNLASAFSGVFRSRSWLGKLSLAALCLVCWWLLLIPFLLFVGYVVAAARAARSGATQLPDWDRLGKKLADGAGLTLVFLIWALPALVAKAAGSGAFDIPTYLVRTLNVFGTGWIGLVLFIQPPIWAQFIDFGVRAALVPSRVLRRLLRHLGVAAVIGTVSWALVGAALLGFLLVVIGAVVTIPYFSVVAARLFGGYARLTSADSVWPPGDPSGGPSRASSGTAASDALGSGVLVDPSRVRDGR